MILAAAPLPATEHVSDTLLVPGMHCAGCMAKVERGLLAVPAVSRARVNLSARTVTVEHEPDIDARNLIAALGEIGFEAQLPVETEAPSPAAVRQFLAPLAVAAFAGMNVMLLSVSIWSGADSSTRSLFHWVSALIAVPAIAFAGRPFFASAWSALRRGRTNMDVPISIGVLIATGLSLYETATHGRHAWFDGALMLLAFLLAGRALDAMMRDRARAGVAALLGCTPAGTLVIEGNGDPVWRKTGELAPGMVMRIAAGERLAADGTIVAGSSRFDLSLLTGESAPVEAGPGDPVLAGTLNRDAPVDVRVTATGNDTSLAEIARLMEAAGQSRSHYVRIADRASRLYAPAVHTLAAGALVGWLVAGAGVHQSLVIAIAVLIITCPCALGLAVPVAQVVASGALMRAGIMVKDGSALERLAQIDRAMLDKTGTLTLGHPVPDPASLAALSDREASILLALASYSRHPLSRSLVQALRLRGHAAADIEAVEERPGEGVLALWQGRKVALRRPETAQGMASALVIADLPPRLIPFADRLRPDARQALDQLRALGLSVSILSGDSASAVMEVAQETGLPARAEVSPQDKQATIAEAERDGAKVLMVGDGLNDGPALAAAHASIAPGSASDVGRQAADLVFVGDSLLALPRAIRAARATMRVVKQNFALAIGYNAIAVPLALAGMVTPLVAAVAMSGSSLIVIANSLRLVRAAR